MFTRFSKTFNDVFLETRYEKWCINHHLVFSIGCVVLPCDTIDAVLKVKRYHGIGTS